MSDPAWGDRLALRVAGAGLTNTQLAAKLAVSKARVGELCRRDSPPLVATVIRLAGALGCEPSDLDPRLSGKSLPLPGSRVHEAARILGQKFEFAIEFVETRNGHYMLCRGHGDASDSLPVAIVACPNADGGWGCLSESRLQRKVLAALDGHT